MEEKYKAEFYLSENALCVKCGEVKIKNISAALEYYGKKYNFLSVQSGSWEIRDGGSVAESETGDGKFILQAGKGSSCMIAGKFTAKTPVQSALRFGISGWLPYRIKSFVYNYADMWFPNGNRCMLEMGTPAKTTGAVKDQTVTGCQYVAFQAAKAGKNIFGVLGAVTSEENFATVKLGENGKFTLYANLNEHWLDLDAVALMPGDETTTDQFYISVQEDDPDILSAYGKKISEFYPVQKKSLPYGWCSWYYYGNRISEEDILENLEEIRKRALPTEYIQIDDGWQVCNGDWEPNQNFPHGMQFLVEKIKENGYQAGLWCAPFDFSEKSETFRNHPEWFIKDANYINSHKMMIDFGTEGARKYLYDLFYKISHEWGFRYVKIDFVASLLALNGYGRKGYNNLKNLKEAFQIIRSAVTEDTYILACSAPLIPLAGLADGLRTGYDIFRWESLKTVARQTAKHYFMYEYINIDPDCLLLRTKDKQEEDCFRLCTRTEEVRTFAAYMQAAGGTLMISDKIALLNAEDDKLYKSLFPLNKKPAVPVDLFEREIPSVYYFGKRNGVEKYTVINWTDKTEKFIIKRNTESFVKCGDTVSDRKVKNLTVKLKAHTALTVLFSESKAF